MTDSGIYFGSNGIELKRFSSRDFVGVMAAHYVGIKVLIATGRESCATERRAKELSIDELYQNVKDKYTFFRSYVKENNLCKENIAYIGDDLNDYGSMKTFAGFKACPADAAPEVKSICDYVSSFKGGTGVVQNVMRYVLGQMDKWEVYIKDEVEAGY